MSCNLLENDAQGLNPLQISASWGCVESVITLLQLGAELTVLDPRERSILSLAVLSGSSLVVEALLGLMPQDVQEICEEDLLFHETVAMIRIRERQERIDAKRKVRRQARLARLVEERRRKAEEEGEIGEVEELRIGDLSDSDYRDSEEEAVYTDDEMKDHFEDPRGPLRMAHVRRLEIETALKSKRLPEPVGGDVLISMADIDGCLPLMLAASRGNQA